MNENILASFKIRELFRINYLQSRFWIKPFDYDDNMQQNYCKRRTVFEDSSSHALDVLDSYYACTSLLSTTYRQLFLDFTELASHILENIFTPGLPPSCTLSGVTPRALDSAEITVCFQQEHQFP